MSTKTTYVSKKNRSNVDESLEKPVSDSSHESLKYLHQMSTIDLTGVEIPDYVEEVKVAE